jgi:hypothetical protein
VREPREAVVGVPGNRWKPVSPGSDELGRSPSGKRRASLRAGAWAWDALDEAGKETWRCLFAAKSLEARGLQKPKDLEARFAEAYRRWTEARSTAGMLTEVGEALSPSEARRLHEASGIKGEQLPSEARMSQEEWVLIKDSWDSIPPARKDLLISKLAIEHRLKVDSEFIPRDLVARTVSAGRALGGGG